ncbi:hypothetical protein BC936DRAFT_146976 [Jimgerdemannia flammicorona]|uniref:Uncharacterized protein n=1 Tax=Jimgerdemannia flammicorona TaxID=994334 RepID=A0A433DL59_9FUNG|nr:hypothetical protein BC936DRAFT_146976 [Jimgerdemannia flammicorona]
MADEENFDIYGDDNFGGVDQHDDIFDEIVGNDNDNRPAKRRRDDNGGDYGGGDDDLFDDFGDIDKVHTGGDALLNSALVRVTRQTCTALHDYPCYS